MRTQTIELTPETQSLLEKVANFQSRSPDAVMRQAIENYLQAESEAIRFLRESLDGLEAAKRNQTFSTFEDLDDWVNKLGTAEEYAEPKTRHINPWQ